MIAVFDPLTDVIREVVPSLSGIDMTGMSSIETPEDYDAGGRNYVLTGGVWAAELTGSKAELVTLINTHAEAVRGIYITAGSGQALSYERKEEEARAWYAGADSSAFVFLTNEAAETGASVEGVAALVMGQANQWLPIGAKIEGVRRRLSMAVESATTVSQLGAIRASYAAELNAAPSQAVMDPVPALPVAAQVSPLRLEFNDVPAGMTLPNLASAANFLGGSNRNVKKVLLAGYTQVRFMARVVTAGTATSKLTALWSSTLATVIGSYGTLRQGGGEIELAINAVGYPDTGWLPLAAAAVGEDRFVTIRQQGGDGAADPAFGPITLMFR